MLANYSFEGKMLPKLGDPGIPTITCAIGEIVIENTLCDLGAGLSVMPYSLFKKLEIGELIPTTVS